MKTLGPEGLFLFSSLDTDHDFYLSPEEFRPIAEKLTGMSSFPRSSTSSSPLTLTLCLILYFAFVV